MLSTSAIPINWASRLVIRAERGIFRTCLASTRSAIAAAPSARSRYFRTASAVAAMTTPLAKTLSGSRSLTLGIVRETYDKWERRAPLCPTHVRALLDKFGDDGGDSFVVNGSSDTSPPFLSGVLVQPASHRIFTDEEYEDAGARLTEDLSSADLILGVKQVEEESLIPDKSYLFFAHVIKGQPENMSLMRAILDKNVQLFDYECIDEEWIDANKEKKRRRVVAFGKYAGIAGVIDAFQCLGRRLIASGYSTPFLNCPPTYMYGDIDDARAGVERLGELISQGGLPRDLEPLIFCFVGRGNVGRGALDMFKLLPHRMITKEELPKIRELKGPQKVVYGLQLGSGELVRHSDDPNTAFDFKHYVENPSGYRSTFFAEKPTGRGLTEVGSRNTSLPFSGLKYSLVRRWYFHSFDFCPLGKVIVNGIYWDERFPRLLTKEQIKTIYESGNKRGSIEFLEKSTTVEEPYFEYDPLTGKVSDGISGQGVAMMSVDILPTELPKESSRHFGDALLPLMEKLIEVKGKSKAKSLHDLGDELPFELSNACISNKGHLTSAFEYIGDIMKKRSHTGVVGIHDPHMLIELRGHLFDSGLINNVLDIMEHQDCHFTIQECFIRRKIEGVPEKSDVLLRVSAADNTTLDAIKNKVKSLIDLIVAADASMVCSNGATKKKKSKAVVKSEKDQKILVLGAGRVAASLSEYLGRSTRRNIVVASKLEDEAHSVASHARRGTGVMLDVLNDPKRLSQLVKDADLVVSLLPSPMHMPIAEECLSYKKNLVTASYVSRELSSLQERCEIAGISILNEVGLDPGMDHMSAMKIIEDIQARGGEVTSFSSVCGGLPAPEAANNPLMYKFSWSPMGVLMASQNDAVYMRKGNVISVEGKDLLASSSPFDAWPSLPLEVLPNRDSLVYADKYGIHSAQTIFRGTLRYNGFSALLHVLKNMGLLDEIPVIGDNNSWSNVLNMLQERHGVDDLKTLLVACSEGNTNMAAKAADCLKWLGITENSRIHKPKSIVQSFCDVLEDKLFFEEGERDMVLMHHEVHALFPDKTQEKHRSSLQVYGDGKMSAMCKTVGYTSAVGADLMLNGELNKKGILLPTSKNIYVPCLAALEKEGLIFKEEMATEANKDL